MVLKDYKKHSINHYSKQLTNALMKVTYNGYLKTYTSYIKDWVSDLYLFSGYLEFINTKIKDDYFLRKAFDEGINYIGKSIKSRVHSFVSN